MRSYSLSGDPTAGDLAQAGEAKRDERGEPLVGETEAVVTQIVDACRRAVLFEIQRAGHRDPLEQADPLETANPLRSSEMTIASPSRPSKKIFVVWRKGEMLNC